MNYVRCRIIVFFAPGFKSIANRLTYAVCFTSFRYSHGTLLEYVLQIIDCYKMAKQKKCFQWSSVARISLTFLMGECILCSSTKSTRWNPQLHQHMEAVMCLKHPIKENLMCLPKGFIRTVAYINIYLLFMGLSINVDQLIIYKLVINIADI